MLARKRTPIGTRQRSITRGSVRVAFLASSPSVVVLSNPASVMNARTKPSRKCEKLVPSSRSWERSSQWWLPRMAAPRMKRMSRTENASAPSMIFVESMMSRYAGHHAARTTRTVIRTSPRLPICACVKWVTTIDR